MKGGMCGIDLGRQTPLHTNSTLRPPHNFSTRGYLTTATYHTYHTYINILLTTCFYMGLGVWYQVWYRPDGPYHTYHTPPTRYPALGASPTSGSSAGIHTPIR